MSMHGSPKSWPQRGQTLVIVAAAMIGLLALAGLAIDGGNLVMERRRAQNAADAAALAGTRLLSLAMMTCKPINELELDRDIARKVNEYAEGDGISDTDGIAGNEVNDNVVAYYVNPSEMRLGTVGAMGTLPLGSSGVEVEVRDLHRTYFLLVVGIRTIPSSAEAMAMTGTVAGLPPAKGLIPVAVPELVVHEFMDPNLVDEQWEMFDKDPKKDSGVFCYSGLHGEEVCIDNPDSPINAHRGWLNLNHIYNREDKRLEAGDDASVPYTSRLNRTFEPNPGAGSLNCNDPLPSLKAYAFGSCTAPPIFAGHSCYENAGSAEAPVWECTADERYDGDFIHGDPGATSSELMAIYDGYSDEVVYAPVFDQVYLHTFFEENEGSFPPADAPIGFSNGGGFSTAAGGWYYHIVGYVAAYIPGGTASNKVLTGQFQGAVITSGEIVIEGYDGSCSLMLHGVTLWH